METAPFRGMVAEWDFARGPRLTDMLNPERSLQYAGASRVAWEIDPHVGGSMVFAGDGGYLHLPPDEVGDLDMGETGQVTVMALVRRDALGHGFIAGLWQEVDSDPRRQYGMFIDLPVYGGGDQVIGHVSRTGGASPRLPYSRDYAASARMVGLDVWRVIAFRYDGMFATAFLDGIADPRPDFIETGSPLGHGLRYAKNPFRFDEGLHSGPLAEFTLGAVSLSSGIGNAFCGRISRLAVWDRALQDHEITELTTRWTHGAVPLANFDWWRADPAPGPTSGGEDGRAWSLESAGARQTAGTSTPVQVLPSRLVREAAEDDAVLELPLVPDARWVLVEEAPGPERLSVSVSDGDHRTHSAVAYGSGIWAIPQGVGATILTLHLGAGAALSLGAVRFLAQDAAEPRLPRPRGRA